MEWSDQEKLVVAGLRVGKGFKHIWRQTPVERKDPKFLKLGITDPAKPISRQEVLRDVCQRMFLFLLSSLLVIAEQSSLSTLFE